MVEAGGVKRLRRAVVQVDALETMRRNDASGATNGGGGASKLRQSSTATNGGAYRCWPRLRRAVMQRDRAGALVGRAGVRAGARRLRRRSNA